MIFPHIIDAFKAKDAQEILKNEFLGNKVDEQLSIELQSLQWELENAKMKEIEDMGYYISKNLEVVSQMHSYDECITNQLQIVAKVCCIKVCFLNRSFLELERKEIAEITSNF